MYAVSVQAAPSCSVRQTSPFPMKIYGGLLARGILVPRPSDSDAGGGGAAGGWPPQRLEPDLS